MLDFLITVSLIIAIGVGFCLFALLMGRVFGHGIKRPDHQELIIDSPAYKSDRR